MESQDVSNTHLTEYEEEKISIRLVSVKKPLYVGTQEAHTLASNDNEILSNEGREDTAYSKCAVI